MFRTGHGLAISWPRQITDIVQYTVTQKKRLFFMPHPQGVLRSAVIRPSACVCLSVCLSHVSSSERVHFTVMSVGSISTLWPRQITDVMDRDDYSAIYY